jgi:hypothetical protein
MRVLNIVDDVRNRLSLGAVLARMERFYPRSGDNARNHIFKIEGFVQNRADYPSKQ